MFLVSHDVMLTSKCAMSTNMLVATDADKTCWIAAPHRWWTLSGSLMTNCESFSIAATKDAQNDQFHTLVGIAWLLHLPARQCTSTHRLRDDRVLGSWNAWFHATMLHSADMMNIFHQWTRLSSPSKQDSNCEHQLRQASLYSRHIMTSALHRD